VSGFLGSVAGTITGATSVVRGISNLAGDLGLPGFGAASGYGRIAPGLGPWAQSLQPASWRGLGFAVRDAGIRRGRRVAVHEYPYRDEVWPEDLGRGTRTLNFTGFLIGDDVYSQRQAFLAAVEQAGQGELVHPSLGSVQAVLVEFACGERAELGRVIELEFAFIQVLPKVQAVPQMTALDRALAAYSSDTSIGAQSSFASDFAGAVKSGLTIASRGLQTVQGYVSYAAKIGGDASLIAHSVTGLVGNFGRYSGGGRSVLQPGGKTISSALSAVVSARSVVSSAANLASSAAALL
jgi:prophage DNA circulation protein